MSDRAAFLRRWRGTAYDKVERNCWWLAALAQAELFGRTLPAADPALVADVRARAATMATHPARAEWREIPTPQDGALVLMDRRAVAAVQAQKRAEEEAYKAEEPERLAAARTRAEAHYNAILRDRITPIGGREAGRDFRALRA